MLRELDCLDAPPEARRAREFVAAALRAAGAALDRLAHSLAGTDDERGTEPVLEFHAEAGAPEGALYIDGQLVGHVVGVSRL